MVDKNSAEINRNNDHVEELFLNALKMEPGERSTFVTGICAENPEDGQQLKMLISRYQRFNGALGNFEDTELLLNTSNPSRAFQQSEALNNFPESPPTTIGPYQILRKLGEGGMGSVYLAQQDAPKRQVALKLIFKNVAAEFLIRFESEYQALALMAHHHIARIFDAGFSEQGIAFISMEYIDGPSITTFCESQCLPLAERLYLFIQVCNGILHAHQKAVIHRDLKPSNILVTEENQRPVAKIIDFGLAKGLHNPLVENAFQTQRGSFLGTPAYMSPELLSLKKSQTPDPRSDIYSLGVILYELLTGLHPFDLARFSELPVDEALRTLRLEEPPRPSERLRHSANADENILQQARRLKGDLDWIVMKAMAKNIDLRYATVEAFRADLVSFLNDKPVTAIGPNRMNYFKKLFYRNKRLFLGATAGAVLLSASLGFAISSLVQTRKSEKKAQLALTRNALLSTLVDDLIMAVGSSKNNMNPQLNALLAQYELDLALLKEVDPPQAAALAVSLGNAWTCLGEFDHGKALLTDAQKTYAHYYGPDSIESCRPGYYLALNLIGKGEMEAAEKQLRQIEEQQLQMLGPDHRHSLQTRAALARALFLQGKNKAAEELLNEVIPLQCQNLGREHADTLKSYQLLSQLHQPHLQNNGL